MCGNWNRRSLLSLPKSSNLYLTRVWELKPWVSPPINARCSCILPVCGNWNAFAFCSAHITHCCILPVCGNWNIKSVDRLVGIFLVSYPCVGIETLLVLIRWFFWTCLYLTRVWELKRDNQLHKHSVGGLYLTRVWELKLGNLMRTSNLPVVSYPCVGIETPNSPQTLNAEKLYLTRVWELKLHLRQLPEHKPWLYLTRVWKLKLRHQTPRYFFHRLYLTRVWELKLQTP